VIRQYNGQAVADAGQLIALVTDTKPGTVATFDILRNGKPLNVKVTLGERPSALGVHASLGKPPAQGPLGGISVQYITPDLRDQLGLPTGTQGVVISNLDPTSPAAQSGIRPGDVIESINRQPVHSVADFERLATEPKVTLCCASIGREMEFLSLFRRTRKIAAISDNLVNDRRWPSWLLNSYSGQEKMPTPDANGKAGALAGDPGTAGSKVAAPPAHPDKPRFQRKRRTRIFAFRLPSSTPPGKMAKRCSGTCERLRVG
jgi:membrane-associated protease RseP (regulator of RpoE activity)